MDLTDQELALLIKLSHDPDGVLKTRARPSNIVLGLIGKGAITNCMITTLAGPKSGGGTAYWRITAKGKKLAEQFDTH